MNFDYLDRILKEIYNNLENKDIFIPLIFCNAIVCYKLTFYDTSYWMEFSHWVSNGEMKLNDFEDLKTFFDWFVRQTPQFELIYNDTYNRLIWYEDFFKDFFIKQKYYYKNPDMLEKHMKLFVAETPEDKLIVLWKKVVELTGNIKFQ